MAENNSKPDWEAIERAFRAGALSIRTIADRHGISDTAIRKRAKALGWEREPDPTKGPVTLQQDEFERSGFVYVVYIDDSAGERFYKIGMAASLGQRLSSLQCSSPFELCIASAYYVGNMRSEERELHSLFEPQRIRGEWFKLTHDDLVIISKRSLLV